MSHRGLRLRKFVQSLGLPLGGGHRFAVGPRPPGVLAEPLESRVLLSSNTLTPIAAFNGTNGVGPRSVVEDSSGNLFGVTVADSTTNTGEVFEVPANTHTIDVLYHFPGGADGASPKSMVIDSSGNLFGTTQSGGADGMGTLFEITHGSSTPTTLLSFTVNGPYFLTGVDATGDLFGYNVGVGIFEVPAGTTNINILSSSVFPNSLTLASDGNLYGTEFSGQNSDGSQNDGAVFEINTANNTFSTLATFDASGANGSAPIGVAVDGSGNVFGVTSQGGNNDSGTAFEIVKGSGVATTLDFFNQNAASVGGQPICAPILDSSGGLLGINCVGGANSDGSGLGDPKWFPNRTGFGGP